MASKPDASGPSRQPRASSPAADTAPIITIDGPSGSGKGTISRQVATRLGWHLLDSGALYRLVALAGLQRGVSPDDETGHAHLAQRLDVTFGLTSAGGEQILLEGTDVTTRIRSEQAGNRASKVAAMPSVRASLLERQRAFAREPGLVADGRDMGTVVFPTAALKIFLTASPEERALRRHKQLKDKGVDANLAALSLEIAERDRRDASRPVAPLRPADDAVIVDSTSMTIDAVVARVLEEAAARFPVK